MFPVTSTLFTPSFLFKLSNFAKLDSLRAALKGYFSKVDSIASFFLFILLFINPKFINILSLKESLGPLTLVSAVGGVTLLYKSPLTSQTNISFESYIQANPYDEPRKILQSCFREGYVKCIKVETGIISHEPLISYVISDKRWNKDDDPEDAALYSYENIFFESEEKVFSNFDEITNMIKENHKNILNGLKGLAEKILKKYE